MSLDHRTGKQEGPEFEPVVEVAGEDGPTTLDEGWATLADEVVPMRERAERNLERDREERIRLVVEKRRRLPRRRPVLGALGMASVLLAGLAVLITLKRGGSDSASDPAAKTAARQLPTTAPPSPYATRAAKPRQARAVARARHRAAIRAKSEAARRRTRTRNKRANTGRGATEKRRGTPQSEPPTTPSPEAEPAPGPSSTSAPAPAPPPSTDRGPAQSEFGFEH